MAKLKGELQADNGDALYPHTSSDVVFGPDGKSVQAQINDLSGNKLGKISSLGSLGKLPWFPYKSSDTNYCNVGCSTDGMFYVSVGTSDASRRIYRFGLGIRGLECSNNGGSTWLPYATTDKIDISTLLVNNWVKTEAWYTPYLTKVGNLVSGTICIRGGIKDYNTTLFTLPANFRPQTNTNTWFIGVCNTTGTHSYAHCDVFIEGSTGRVAVNRMPENDWVVINIAYAI